MHSRIISAVRLSIILAALLPGKAGGHDGPPFPIAVDEEVGPFRVSVWSDPDIGIGTFFVVLEPLHSGELPEIEAVRLAVQPESGRLNEATHEAEAQRVRHGARYYAEVPFDQGEWWKVRVLIASSGGGGEMTTRVEVTPDGTIGPIGLVLYLLPFLAVGFIWLRGFLIHRREGRPTAPRNRAALEDRPN